MTRTYDPAAHCGATRHQAGGPCCHPKGFRTGHAGSGNCFLHGGSTQNGRKAAEREMQMAALRKLGVPVETDPQQALLSQVWEAAGNVAFLRGRVQELETPPLTLAEAGVSDQALPRLYGPDHLGDNRPHVLWSMYNEERERLAKICKLAIDAGIAERSIAIAEQQADAMVAVVARVLDSMALSPDQRAAAQGVAVVALREFADFEVLATGRVPARAGR